MSLLSGHKQLQEPTHRTPLRYAGHSWQYDADQHNWYHSVENPDYWDRHDTEAERYIHVYANGEKQQLWQQYEREQRPRMCGTMFWLTMLTTLCAVVVLATYAGYYIPSGPEAGLVIFLPIIFTPVLLFKYLRSHYRLDLGSVNLD